MDIANVTLTVRCRWHTATMEARLRVHEGGSGEPLLALLHGLGATGDVWAGWRPLLARQWPGRWLAPDPPRHGGPPRLGAGTLQGVAPAIPRIDPPRAPGGLRGHLTGGGRGRGPGPGDA